MKNTLLMSAAAAVLVTASGIAVAQSPMDQRQPPAASEQKAPESSKSGSVEQKANTGAQIQAGDKPALNAQTEEKAGVKTETTGQAPAAKQQDNKAQETQKQDNAKPETTQSKSGTGAASSSGTGASAQGSSGASASVNLTPQQKTTIRETVIRSSNAPRLSNVNFSLTVGTVVPRSVRFAALPPTLIEIYPTWRGYEYFLVGDQIVVVDPRSLRIVAILSV